MTLLVAATDLINPPSSQQRHRSRHKSSSIECGVPLVIDHGSWECRAGFATDSDPVLQFENVVAKVRDKFGHVSTVVGSAAQGQHNARSCFDSETSCVVHAELLEHELDYVFSQLGLQETINHPILFTETPCHPIGSRELTTELLFECYQVPAVTFGLDSLYSYTFNGGPQQSGLLISAGHTATHILPIYDQRWDSYHAKRLPVGGLQMADTLLRMLQLKYPTFPAKATPQLARSLFHQYCHVAEDYAVELERYAQMDVIDNESVVVQFAYPEPIQLSAEEQALAQQRREQQRNRMRDFMAKKRDDKLATKKRQLEEYLLVLDSGEKDRDAKMRLLGYRTVEDLQKAVQELEFSIRKIEASIQGIELPVEPKAPPSWPLLDISDSELTTESELKEKRKQRLLKAGWEAREKIRQQRERERQQKAEEERREEERRLADPQGWLEGLYEHRARIQRRLRERERQERELADRKSAASQARLKTIAALAANDETGAAVTMDNGGGAGAKKRRRKQATRGDEDDGDHGDYGDDDDDDGFGADDADWQIYRDIKTAADTMGVGGVGADEAAASDDDDSNERDQMELDRVESLLLQHDPEFDPEALADRRRTLYHCLKYGSAGYVKSSDLAGQHQLRVNVERIRVPEILFQPSIIGLDCAGLMEIIQNCLCQYPATAQQSMVQNVFLTGSMAAMPGIRQRLERELRSLRPQGSQFTVRLANNSRLDGWRGAAKWARQTFHDNQIDKMFITRREYDEMGAQYLKEHFYTNRYIVNKSSV